MILVERDVPAVGAVLASTKGGADVAVHVQQPDERPLALAHAALNSVGALEREGRALFQAAMVVGADTSAEARAARELLARALVTHMVATGGGELELVGPNGSHLGVREDLLLLVEELLMFSALGLVTIRIRFAEDSEPVRAAQRAA